MKFNCVEYNWELCASICCEVYPMTLYLREPINTKLEKWCKKTGINVAIVLNEPQFQ
jgi:hypothetical protein